MVGLLEGVCSIVILELERSVIKRVRSSQVQPGMFIHKLECGWTNHPFLRNQFKIRSEKEVQKIRKAGIHWVQIDTSKGADVVGPAPQTDSPTPVTFHEEIEVAAGIQKEAREKISGIMEDIKLGRNLNIKGLGRVVSDMTHSVFRNQSALTCLGRIRSKDQYLFEHSVNLGVLMAIFGKFKGFDEGTLNDLVLGSLLHDIGKIKVRDEILHKPGRLTADEFEHMKMHVVYTERLLEETDGIPESARQIASEHHEKMNGKGYSRGLKGDQISLYGRMAAIVDVYDALTASRCYKDGLPPSQVLKMMTEWGASHLDPTLLREFIRCVGVFPVGSLVELTDRHLAIILENGSNPLRPLVRMVMHLDTRRAMSPRDVNLAESDLRIVDFADFKTYGIHLSDYVPGS